MDQPYLEGGEQQQEMSFVDHLEELRWHIIRSVGSILVFAIAAFMAKGFVFHDIILAPSRTDFFSYKFMCEIGQRIGSDVLCIEDLGFTIQSRQMSGQFAMHIMVSLVLGLACAFPYAFWEIWRFIKPGLYPQEQQNSRGAVFWVSVLFAMGLLFGYYVVSPISINFLAGYQVDPTILNEFDLSSYISTLTTLCLACAFMFELPVIVYFFTKAGLLSPEIMKLYRRHSIVVILVLSAIITPPDVISQLLISFPLILLYEVSISVSRRIIKSDLKRLNENNA
ncbi:twin-arginine translocase subunit TatC [Pontibacter sp. JH31]|uniref:Sec-independent protein translocase protein TatC n=1 Tax=Pontibacter aquaedesilientis TaxID=2766980 RepID=A0ABR7XGG1_9BACT|nr:twin-arginine translocase subunit TatC [Pontibacter aquaedesilientis]MBD1397387.1 twin-arginine translocase subunit TatC [Pontibacter aquaedesilientis]